MTEEEEESLKRKVKQVVEGDINEAEILRNGGVNKGAWTAEEDQKLAQVIAIHGAKRWKSIAAKAGPSLSTFNFSFFFPTSHAHIFNGFLNFPGLNRCGKSCRLRWLNYLRPNIKRGNISDQEEDLILRLHKLLGNRSNFLSPFILYFSTFLAFINLIKVLVFGV